MTCIPCYFSSSWACVQCKAPYDMEEIEDTLLDAIHRKSMAFILQDLKCVKCNGVSYFIIGHKMNRLTIIADDSFSYNTCTCIYTVLPGVLLFMLQFYKIRHINSTALHESLPLFNCLPPTAFIRKCSAFLQNMHVILIDL